jgi:FMN phosphatase YigB (HAD superfamily)
VIFDLDETLYDERLYLYAGYKEISLSLSHQYNIDATELEQFLIDGFENGGRSTLFDDVCEHFNIPTSAIDDMLHILRTVHIPHSIELFDAMKGLLNDLHHGGKKLFVVTNGNPDQQRNKIKSIRWYDLDKHIVFVIAADHKPKPDRAAFDYLLANFGLIPSQTIFIGDSAADEGFAKNSHIAYMHVSELLHPNKG